MENSKIGYIVGEVNPTEFWFAVDEEKHPQRWDYVIVKSREFVDGEEKEVYVLAQIETIISHSLALNNPELVNVKAVERMLEEKLVEPRTLAKARVLGFIHNGEVFQPRRAIYPGEAVYLAPKEILETFYSYPENESLFVGHLITRPEIPVFLSLKGFRRHLAILAQTGAGKSYTAGVLIEELLKKGATIVVIDPHADYVFLSMTRDAKNYSNRITVFQTLKSTGRYNLPRKPEIYQVKFSDLSLDEIAFVCGIEERFTNILMSLRDALNNLKNIKKDYSLNDLIAYLQNNEEVSAFKALNYLNKLEKMNIFGDVTTDMFKILKPMHVSVMDLSGLEDRVSDYVTFRILTEIYSLREKNEFEFPVFVFIEEAHNFVPNKENTLSKGIIKRIAAEGRKFGVFLILITQRPNKIDPDVLSQCNSQIIMQITNPEDQKAVRASSERMSEDLLKDLPGLNIGEPVIVGEMTKVPVMVKIRQRETKEGGADIDVVDSLQKATEKAKEEERNKELELKEIKKMMQITEGY
jgi:DNA helicase HerA-like ATPase